MEHVHFITTGGTIDKKYSQSKGTYNFTIGSPAIERILERLPEPDFTYTITELYQIDSLDMETAHRNEIEHACETAPSDNIIITHGTDTLIQTAQHLANQDQFTTKTIILTGATQPEKMKHTDADLNLGTALAAADILPQGVHIAIHGQVYKPRNLTKTADGKFEYRGNR